MFCGANPRRLAFSNKKPNILQIKNFRNHDEWWDTYKEFVKGGIKESVRELMKEKISPHIHFLAMSGNLLNQDKAWGFLFEVLTEVKKYIDFSEFDSYINLMPPNYSNLVYHQQY